MASKNLGAVIQRAISDGAFRRQLQSDPAAALRGFNLSPDEIAAIRSGDSGKLMSLGVDQRMSKAFTVGGGFLGATRSTASDLSSGGANTLVGDATVGTREGIVGTYTFFGTQLVSASWKAVRIYDYGQAVFMNDKDSKTVLQAMEAASDQLATRLQEPTTSPVPLMPPPPATAPAHAPS